MPGISLSALRHCQKFRVFLILAVTFSFAFLVVPANAQVPEGRLTSKLENNSDTPVTKAPAKTNSQVSLRVCPITASGSPCTPTAVIYEDKEMGTLKTSDKLDANGSYSFYATAGSYLLEITADGIGKKSIPVELPSDQNTQYPQLAVVKVQPEPFSLTLAGNLISRDKSVTDDKSKSTSTTASSSDDGGAPPAKSDLLSFNAVQIINHARPDPLEIKLRPSQEHPVCSVQNKSADNWVLYYCGHPNEFAMQREKYQTVFVYAGDGPYKLHHRVAGLSWWATFALATGVGVADVEITQWNIHRGAGHEGNPLLGSSRAQAYSVTAGIGVVAALVSLHRKRAMTMNDELGIQRGAQWWNRLPWWTPFMGQITAHAVGIASGLAGK